MTITVHFKFILVQFTTLCLVGQCFHIVTTLIQYHLDSKQNVSKTKRVLYCIFCLSCIFRVNRELCTLKNKKIMH